MYKKFQLSENNCTIIVKIIVAQSLLLFEVTTLALVPHPNPLWIFVVIVLEFFAVISKSFSLFPLELQIDLGLLCMMGQCSTTQLSPQPLRLLSFCFLFTIKGIVNYPKPVVLDTWILNPNTQMICGVFLSALDSFFLHFF